MAASSCMTIISLMSGTRVKDEVRTPIGLKKEMDVRAGFISFNLINETEIIVITNASHALNISKSA